MEKSQQLYLAGIDKNTAVSFTQFLKIDKQYSDNYCGQLLKLLIEVIVLFSKNESKTSLSSNKSSFNSSLLNANEIVFL